MQVPARPHGSMVPALSTGRSPERYAHMVGRQTMHGHECD